MYIDSLTFERNDNNPEDIVKPCSELHINLLPAREQVRNILRRLNCRIKKT